MAQNVVAAVYADIILVKDHVWEVFGELYRCKLNIKETYINLTFYVKLICSYTKFIIFISKVKSV